jgi:hypothetical protein
VLFELVRVNLLDRARLKNGRGGISFGSVFFGRIKENELAQKAKTAKKS